LGWCQNAPRPRPPPLRVPLDTDELYPRPDDRPRRSPHGTYRGVGSNSPHSPRSRRIDGRSTGAPPDEQVSSAIVPAVGRLERMSAPAGPTRSPTREARPALRRLCVPADTGRRSNEDLLRARRVERRTPVTRGGSPSRRRRRGSRRAHLREPGGRAHQGVFFAGAAWSYAACSSVSPSVEA